MEYQQLQIELKNEEIICIDENDENYESLKHTIYAHLRRIKIDIYYYDTDCYPPATASVILLFRPLASGLNTSHTKQSKKRAKAFPKERAGQECGLWAEAFYIGTRGTRAPANGILATEKGNG